MAINMTPFWDGLTDGVAKSALSTDQGRKQYRLIEGLLANVFTKIVGVDVVRSAYAYNDPRIITAALRKFNVEEEQFGEFVRLIGEARNPKTRERDSFSEAQYILLGMFRKKVEYQVAMGELSPVSVEPSIRKFSGALVHGKKALISIFPNDEVKHLLLNVDHLESAIDYNVQLALENCDKIMPGRGDKLNYYPDGQIAFGPVPTTYVKSR